MPKPIVIVYASLKECSASTIMEEHIALLRQSLDTDPLLYQHPKEYDTRILGRFLLLKGLAYYGYSKELLADIQYTPFGKPVFNTFSELDFCISHAGDFAICAISKTSKIGIDIEEIKDLDIANFRDHFSTLQWEAIENHTTPLSLFYDYWVQKEAITKGCGKGLAMPLAEIDIIYNSSIIDDTIWQLMPLELDTDYCAWIAMNPMLEIDLIRIL